MLELTSFLAGQNEVYSEFRKLAGAARKKGIEQDANLSEKFGGFFVVLRHSPDVARHAEEFSRRIASVVPAVIYGKEHAHTTLARYCYSPGFRSNPDLEENRIILEKMSDAVRDALPRIRRSPLFIDYTEFLYTPSVAIAAGNPNEGFVRLFNAISAACEARGIEIQPPWGSHITLSRFEATISAKNLEDFFDFFEMIRPLGRSVPVAVSVGYSLWEPDSRHLNANTEELCGHFAPYRSFPLFSI